MKFKQYGRASQLVIDNAGDLQHVLDLDDALWVATGAPTSNLKIDPLLLDYVDYDSNGRIMCREIKEAIKWTLAHLRDKSGVDAASDILKLESINIDTDDGNRVHDVTSKLLQQLGKSDDREISLTQVREQKKTVEQKPVSEDGVAILKATEDKYVQEFMGDLIATVEGADHPSGEKGVNKDELDEFLKLGNEYLEWHAGNALSDDGETTDIMPLGASTTAAYGIYAELRPKIEQFFAQCDLLASDPAAAEKFRPVEKEGEEADFAKADAILGYLKEFPIAQPKPGGKISFDAGINRAYVDKLEMLREQVLTPIMGRDPVSLSKSDWETVKKTLKAHDEWVKAKPTTPVEKLGADKLKSYCTSGIADSLTKLIEEGKRTAVAMDNLRLAEKLILYQANMLQLVNNFVSFPYLYDPADRAIFEVGTLTIDGRHMTFCVKIDNRAEHSKVTKNSSICLIYAEIIPTDGTGKYEIAAPVTAGAMGNLCVGKRGIFHDIAGKEHDAKVVQIIENPISVKEAAISPFVRLTKALTGRIEKLTTAAEKKLDATATKTLDKVQAAPTAAGAAPQQSRGLMAGGLLMGGGVAIAALSSAVAYATSALSEVAAWKIILGVACAILAVIAPASIMAMMKLRRRDLSTVLEGSGWAINSRMRLTIKQGMIFTHEPGFPSKPFGLPKWAAYTILVILVVAAIFLWNVCSATCQ